jgi:threonine dehydrogenase-like Zn-dependent dehydrogenase
VVGLGPSGLLHLQLLRARGLTKLIGITRSETKRDLGMRLGAIATSHPDDAEECVGAVTGGSGADIVVESVGTIDALAQAVELASPGGRVLSYGSIRASEGRLGFVRLYEKELRIVAARGALPRDYATAIELAATRVVELAPLVSAIFPLNRAPDAFAALSHDPTLVKVLLEIPG